jgi:uncharacterized phage infection (PIP) family protein YhgE
MPPVVELRENIAGSVEELQQILDHLNNACQLCDTNNLELNQEIESAVAAYHTLTDCFSDLQQTLETGQDAIATLEDTLQNEWDTFQAAIQEAEQQLEAQSQSLDEHHEASETLIRDRIEDLTQSAADVESQLETAQGFLEDHTQLFAEEQEQTQVVFDDLGDAIDQFQDQHETGWTETDDAFDASIDDIQDRHLSDLQQDFTRFEDYLTQDCLLELIALCDDLEIDIGQLFDAFKDKVFGLGEELQERGKEILKNVTDHAQDTLKQEMEDMFHRLLEEALTALLNEMIENVVVASVGATVTGALTPVLPKIIAAKVATGMIKNALTLGGIF